MRKYAAALPVKTRSGQITDRIHTNSFLTLRTLPITVNPQGQYDGDRDASFTWHSPFQGNIKGLFMDLDALKDQFRHKQRADLSEIDIALRALPFLIREIERLERELDESRSRIAQLSAQLNKAYPLSKKGKKGQGEWDVRIDEEKNRLYLQLSGHFDYQAAKVASNAIVSILPSLRENADAINDLSRIKGFDNRAMFHIRKVIYTLEYVGVRRMVRILGDNSKLSDFLAGMYSNDAPYQMATAGSVEEAEALLDHSRKFLKT